MSRFERLMIALAIDDNARKRALLLHYAGPEVDDIFDTLEDTGDKDDYDRAKTKLNNYFKPKKNTAYEVYQFRQAAQNSDESLDAYLTRLRKLAKTCNFHDTDREICAQIITSCKSNQLRRKALREDYNLENLLKAGRAFEISEQQASKLEENTVNAVNPSSQYPRRSRGRGNYSNRGRGSYSNRGRGRGGRSKSRDCGKSQLRGGFHNTDTNVCGHCGGKRHKSMATCPAQGKECRACSKLNHFARMCRSKAKNQTAHSLQQEQEDTTDNPEEEDYAFAMAPQQRNPATHCNVFIGEGATESIIGVMIDSGASINLIDSPTYRRLQQVNPKLKLKPPDTKVYTYGSDTPLSLKGTFTTIVQYRSSRATVKKTCNFYVTEGNGGNLLGFSTAQDLGILHIVKNISNSSKLPDDLVEFSGLFHGVGKLKDKQVDLHIDESVEPKQQRHRRIPFHIRKQVEETITKLERDDIIEKVEGPTPWVSPVVTVPKKNGDIRLCVDMRVANRAIKRERHIMPTLDDLVSDLNGSTVFTTLDLSQAYHQLELSVKSRHITTFSTHLGLRRYKRLFFGINSASEVFQNIIAEMLSDLQGCKNISDDIIVHGLGDAQHDERLKAVLRRLLDHGLRLNLEKCRFRMSEVVFYGHIFSGKGVKADPKKIKTIRLLPKPSNCSEVKSFLGMTQYLARFIKGYAGLTSPLRELTRKNVDWNWGVKHDEAFAKIKGALTETTVMRYFDPKLDTELAVDAGPCGLGAILTQAGKVVSYGSRALSDVETRYSQTEKEMLAVVWAVEHYHLYLYGNPAKVFTDHKPLLGIFSSQKPMSPRIERWRLRLMPYKISLEYRPGRNENNPADYLSRHPSGYAEHDNMAEDYVKYVCSNAVPKAMTLEQIRLKTREDPILERVKRAIESGDWCRDDETLKPFNVVKDELAVYNGLLLRGTRIVLPRSLQSQAVDLAHVGHQGIVKTKRLLREKVWFSGIDTLVEEKVKNCLACQATSRSAAERPEPLKMTKLPQSAWKEISVDFFGPLSIPSAEYLLVLTDEYSRFPEVEIVTSTSAKATIPRMDSVFSRQGVPETVKSDNGPPFTSEEFSKFADYLGFKHRKITPLYPQANGEAERFMQSLGKVVRCAYVEGRNWRQELQKFLRQYRATPHSTTGLSPFEALTGRKMKTQLPQIDAPVCSRDTQIRKTDRVRKEKIKLYADSKRFAKDSPLAEGDAILLKQPRMNKLAPPFDPKPFKITKRKGNMVTVERDGRKLTRNITHCKRIPSTLYKHGANDESDIELSDIHIPEHSDEHSDVPHSDHGSDVPDPAIELHIDDLPSQPEKSSLKPTLSRPQRSTRGKTPVRFKDCVMVCRF